MFYVRRPSAATIARALDDARRLPLSYGSPGVLHHPGSRRVDATEALLGQGPEVYTRACLALSAWRQFDIGWVELHPAGAPVTTGTDVAVLIRHFGFWSLNGCRVVDQVGGDAHGRSRFGYVYGTLPTHAEAGEEQFEVSLDAHSGAVVYRIRAVSWPFAGIAHLGQPVVRHLQARFRHDSAAAMQRAAGVPGTAWTP